MSKNLLIVESPAKAKTIEKILGADFKVKSSMGHIRDLEKNGLAIDIQNNFKPNYIITPEKIKLVKELREEAKHASEVWLATDEDREGEAISWHLCQVLNLNEQTTKRIVFREITKPAILKAVQNPRKLDLHLVDAQQARRVLDRLVGFELSELLWKKIKGNLSAGRVQSVAVKLVVERERAIQNFDAKPFFKIEASFGVINAQSKRVELKAEAANKPEIVADAETFLKQCVGATYTVRKIEVRPTKRKPAAPFTTSTLQQEASRKLGFSVNRTMQNAQRLYEGGHISYMRTDSTNLSEEALANIAETIKIMYGPKYSETRRYKTNKESAQEAHEAIRPTYVKNQMVSDDRDAQKLYELIWKRTVASQMADAELEKTVVDIGISTVPTAKLVAEGEIIQFDGFLKVYLESKDEEDEDTKGMLPPLKVGQMLDFNFMTATEKFTRPLARFTEAALVKELEERGIGRPSTYAPTITKIMEENRGYVIKETREGTLRAFQILTLDKLGKIAKSQGQEKVGSIKNHLLPTDMGLLVVDFLDKHFDKVMNYGFTANVEKEFDDIAEGKNKWTKMISNFYTPFHADVERTKNDAERVSGERILDKHPKSGRTVLVRMSKFGPLAQIGTGDELAEKEKPLYANLKPGQSLETITMEEVLKLFELPKRLGELDGTDIIVASGPYGAYIKLDKLAVPLPKGIDPLEVTLEDALKCIAEKQKADAPVFVYEKMSVTKGVGRFGPFIKWNDMYINIPKKYNIDTLTFPQAVELIEAKSEKEANRFIHNWEKEKISVENGRWGAFIRFGKTQLSLKKEGKKMTNEDAAKLTLDEVKALISIEVPGAFDKKEKVKKEKKSK
jgi:DNA topoisomerase-1